LNALEYTIEETYKQKGYNVICGIDEAGRGPLAGSVVAAACVLPEGLYIDGVNDSKKLSPKKREQLFDEITEKAIAYGIGNADENEIDDINILSATLLAMRRAVANLKENFPSISPDLLIIDGNVSRGFDIPAIAIVKGDSLSPSIAAASILAKVTRDRLCLLYEEQYPGYGFAKHKGYGTKEHIDNIRNKGVLPIHRKSFLKNL
jgi:ribonuclease HII